MAEKLLLGFVVLAELGNVSSFWNGEIFWPGYDPYASYYDNPGIRGIQAGALLLTLAIAGLLGYSLRKRDISSTARTHLHWLCVLGAALPVLELWWGSTFYYGEVRDKQGLPFGVVFGGPVGSAVFLTYLLARSRVPLGSRWRRRVLLLAAALALIWMQLALLRLVEEAWNLGQS